MSICGFTPMSIVYEDEIQAPFAGTKDDAAEKLFKMGVIDEKTKINADALTVLANTFASNFADKVLEYCNNETEALEFFVDAARRLWNLKEITGLYYYLLLCCGMVEYSVPKEIICIARRSDALYAYMQKFIGAMQSYVTE